MKKKETAQSESMPLSITTGPAEMVTMVCPKGRVEVMPKDAEPLCGGACCNFRRKMKPRVTCVKCGGTGQKFPGARRHCTDCWGNGTVTPEFTEEEKA